MLVGAAAGGVVQWLALIALGNAYLGFVGAFLAASTTWIVAGMPAILCYSLIKNYPGLWRNPEASRGRKVLITVGLLIVFSGAAEVLYMGIGWFIGWVADLDCARALQAGVTGSRPC